MRNCTLWRFHPPQGKSLEVRSESSAVSEPKPLPPFAKFDRRKPRTNKQLEALNKIREKDPSQISTMKITTCQAREEKLLPKGTLRRDETSLAVLVHPCFKH
jgi:hypothetical protein